MRIQKLDSAKTVNGQAVEIRINDSALMIEGAVVNVMSGNGVIHVIDEFIFPN
jgi:uncharacterized surface protein with fasciclin (FAS1) repeats